MNEQADAQDRENAPTDEDDALFADEDLVAAPPKRSKLPLVVSLLALLIACAALALAFYPGLKTPAPAVVADDSATSAANSALEGVADVSDRADANARRLDSLDGGLGSVQQSLGELRQSLGAVTADSRAAGSDIDALERRIEQQLRALESVPARIASVESTMTALRGISTGARDTWLLAQAEHFLQIANAEVTLSRNPEVALAAMRMADERLLTVGDPGLTDVRRTLSTEMQALTAVEPVDLAGTAVALGSLAGNVQDLPLRKQLLDVAPNAEGADASIEGLTGTDRALASLRNLFSGAFDIRRTDERAEPLIAPEAAYFLETNLSLQLQAARLALLRGESALIDASLNDAETWLRRYYDLDDANVQGALATLEQVRATQVASALPDVSTSLRQLRQYIAFEEAGRAAAPTTSTTPARQPARPAAEAPRPAPETEQRTAAAEGSADSADPTNPEPADPEPVGALATDAHDATATGETADTEAAPDDAATEADDEAQDQAGSQ